MSKLIGRIIMAVGVASILSSFGLKGNAIVLQTLFTVLGIVFSISMSLLVSFNLSKVLNKELRHKLRENIVHTRKMLLWDFISSTIALFIALVWSETSLRYELTDWLVVDVMLVAVVVVIFSLIYEIYNFNTLHRLNSDIEDAVIEEESRKVSR